MLFRSAALAQITNTRGLRRSHTGALTYESNESMYKSAGTEIQGLGFKVAEHPDFGGTKPVHAAESYHKYGEAFDITHQTGDYDTSIQKTRLLKEVIRSLNPPLFLEIIGPGDGDPKHSTHLHLGGLARPITPEDIKAIQKAMGGKN